MQGGDPEGHAEERGAINFLRHVQLSSLVLPSLGGQLHSSLHRAPYFSVPVLTAKGRHHRTCPASPRETTRDKLPQLTRGTHEVETLHLQKPPSSSSFFFTGCHAPVLAVVIN